MMIKVVIKERPIPYTGPMVCATLDGRKWQTRRVVNPQPSGFIRWNSIKLNGYAGWTDEHGTPRPCPYGKPGDLLWVRETWRIGAWDEHACTICVDYKADGYCRTERLAPPDLKMFDRYCRQSDEEMYAAGYDIYAADESYRDWERGESPCRWRPPRFMPRFASRILLEITNIRAERVQDITPEDAAAEGVQPAQWQSNDEGYICEFQELWDSINAERGFGWDVNPWVWVIEFRRVENA